MRRLSPAGALLKIRVARLKRRRRRWSSWWSARSARLGGAGPPFALGHIMKTLRIAVAVSLASVGTLALGCEHTEDRNVATADPASTHDAAVVNRLSNARCGREAACDNVGDGKKYASQQVCMDKMRGGIANDINSYQCPRGIDATAVSQCLMAVGNEECGAHPIEAITRMDKCRSGAMCMK